MSVNWRRLVALRARGVFLVMALIGGHSSALAASATPLADEWSVFIITAAENRERRTRIWIVGLDKRLYVRTGSTRWHDDVRRAPRVTIEHCGGDSTFRVQFVSDAAEHRRVMQTYREKYGWMDWVIHRRRGTTMRLVPVDGEAEGAQAPSSVNPREPVR